MNDVFQKCYEPMPEAVRRALSIAGHIDVMIHNGGVSQRVEARDTHKR